MTSDRIVARYHEAPPCEPGRCYQAVAVGAQARCLGECVAARYLGGRRVEDVAGPTDAADDIEIAPESFAQLTCPEWTI